MTLLERLERAAASPDGVRFVGGAGAETSLSYRELWRRALEHGGALRALGLEPGERVAIVLPTAPSFFDAFFGTLAAGGVPVPLYPPVRLGRLEEYHARTAAMLSAVEATVVLTDARLHPLLGPSVAAARPRRGCLRLEELRPTPAPVVQRDPGELAFIQFSSGTTRAPRPVALTHAQVLANVGAIAGAILAAYPEEGFRHSGVSWLPLYHDMGLVGCVLSAVCHPAPLTLIPPEQFIVRPAVWLQAISRYQATISPAPNFAYALCADRVTDEELAGVDLSSWRVALNGAEPVTPAVLERFVTRFAAHGLRKEALTPVYGLAEATLAVTFSDLRRPFSTRTFARAPLVDEGRAVPAAQGVPLVSLGRPLAGFAVRVVSATGAPCAAGEVGKVLVSGPSLMRGYLGDAEATAAVLDGDWLDTGDLGFFCDGELFLYGRAKDLVVVRGKNHAPQEIEQALEGLAGVRPGCCAAIGVVPDGGDGEELVMLVERHKEQPVDAAALAEAVRGRIAEACGLVPHRVELLPPGTLPRTSSGKLRRGDARTLYLRGALAPPAAVNAPALLWQVLRGKWSHARARLRR